MKLVIVESPKKCETIAKYLGNDFVVKASKGHIRDLSKHGKGGLGIDIENDFKPDWIVSTGKYPIIKELSASVRKADEVYLATDPDREGEAISYHLAEVLHLPLESTKRLMFHEITKPAILEAMENPKNVNLELVSAQEARRMEDRIIGFRISGLLKQKVAIKSAGRVQSSTLGMIVDRQKEIDSFIPEEYWTIEAELEIDGKTFKANLTKVDGKPFKCSSKEEADAILAKLPKELTISKITEEEKSINPKMPLITSTLQQEAFTKFHFSNKKTQDIAQKLYEGLDINGEHVGLITYMRVDVPRISPDFFNRHAVPFIKEAYGDAFVGTLRNPKKNGTEQDAHESIRPTGTHRTPDLVSKYVTPDEAKLYRLIYTRAIGSLMAPKRISKTTLTLSGNGLDFSLSGSVTLFKGYSAIYGEFDDKDEDALPPTKEGDTFIIKNVLPEQKFTKPAPQYNEASIVKAMEENGIGRPSTYATTIQTLIARKYVTAVKGVLSPTEDGFKCIEVLKQYFPNIVDTSYTALMEKKLDDVENGKLKLVGAMNDFYIPFVKEFEDAKIALAKESETGEFCPVCGRPLVRRLNKKGQVFVGCSGFPECDYIVKEEKKIELVGENCPECGKPLVYKMTKRGQKFVGCSGYPTCKYTRSLDGKVKEKKEPVVYTEKDYIKVCPECGKGHLVIKQGKRAKYIGCTAWPKCRYFEFLPKEKKKND